MSLVRHVAEIVSQLIIQDKEGCTHDAIQEESHEMMSPSKQ